MNRLKWTILLTLAAICFSSFEVSAQNSENETTPPNVSAYMEGILARAQVAGSAAEIILQTNKLRDSAEREFKAGRRDEAIKLLRQASELITSAMRDTDGKRDDALLLQYLNDIKARLVDSDSMTYSLELATLELSDEEQTTDTPVSLKSIQLIESTSRRGGLGFSFQTHPLIQQFINYYQRRGRTTMEVGLRRSGQFTRMARRIFREEGVPENLVWLGQVESVWNPWARSWASASGLWQFIPSTGTRYGLRQTVYLDERNNYEKGTRASAKYLRFLANRYRGNWELALAAYNSGEGNVDRAIARAGVANFWVIYPYLPRETKNYVPNILATILIANFPDRYGFGTVRPLPPIAYEKVRIPPSTSLISIAQMLNTTPETLRYLNPDLRQNFTPPEMYQMLVPAGSANLFNSLLFQRRRIPSKPNNINRTGYIRPDSLVKIKARKGDTITRIASRYGFPAIDLARLNGVMPDTQLPTGREILLPNRR